MPETQSNTKPRRPRKDYTFHHQGQSLPAGLAVQNPNAAGIDVGAAEHYVSVPEDRDPQPIRRFACFTPDLRQMAQWLKACRVDTVVLESTGVYWIPVFRVLEEEGVTVLLVDARHVKYVPGRKTDVADCQWLRQLHTFGLLSAAFVPPQDVLAMRTYWRQREELVTLAAREIQHMQKALTQMNLQLHQVLSDISGLSGLRIIRAMVEGERDPVTLAQMAHPSVKRSEAEIARALTGHYTDEQMFCLKQSLELYDIYQKKMAECDGQLEAYLGTLNPAPSPEPAPDAAPVADAALPAPAAPTGPAAGPETPSSLEGIPRLQRYVRRKNQPYFDLRAELVRLAGVDLTAIDGIDTLTAFTICSEIGFEVSAFANEKQFCSWLGLCPNHQITGGKVKRRRTRHTHNRVANALRVAAQSLHHSDSYLGAFYRHMRARLGAPKAITATAHKLARLVYALLKHGQAYVDKGQAHLEAQHRERRLKSLIRQAKALGLDLLDPATGELFTATF